MQLHRVWRVVSVVVLALAVQTAGADTKKQIQKIKSASLTKKGHKVYKSLTGDFEYKIKWWPSAGAEPQEGDALVKRKRIVEARFLHEKGDGQLPGLKYDTVVIYGYDNATEEHTAVWMSTLGTHTLETRGTYDSSTMTFSMTGSFVDAATGLKTDVRTEMKLLDRRGKAHLEVFFTPEGGEEFKTLDIEMNRKLRRSA